MYMYTLAPLRYEFEFEIHPKCTQMHEVREDGSTVVFFFFLFCFLKSRIKVGRILTKRDILNKHPGMLYGVLYGSINPELPIHLTKV